LERQTDRYRGETEDRETERQVLLTLAERERKRGSERERERERGRERERERERGREREKERKKTQTVRGTKT
jgi:hypothetical protein